MNTTDLLTLFGDLAGLAHGDGPLDLRTHSMQTAWHGVMAGADSECVAAALLHDIGALPEIAAAHGTEHDVAAHVFLLEHFEHRVAWLAGAHVVAKRYLAAIDHSYESRCPPAAREELLRSGGAFDAAEARAFLRHPYALDAVNLAYWDSADPIPDSLLPRPEVFVTRLEPLLLSHASA